MKHFLFLLLALPLVFVSCNPDEDDSELSGCMDPDAVNFSANATVDDDSCVYGESSGCGGVSTVTYDGYTYALVAIGDQCWFAENLRNEHYANGDAIAGELNEEMWENADLTNSGAQAIYANNSSHLATYGRLYNWFAVDDARGLCPSGWHVPTDGEYTTLTDGLGGLSVAGGKMKSSASDSPAWDGTNTSGFSGLAGGFRLNNGVFDNGGSSGYFWSASASGTNAWYRTLHGGFTGVYRNDTNQKSGFSVRCVRD